jgi:hypothetical protein
MLAPELRGVHFRNESSILNDLRSARCRPWRVRWSHESSTKGMRPLCGRMPQGQARGLKLAVCRPSPTTPCPPRSR